MRRILAGTPLLPPLQFRVPELGTGQGRDRSRILEQSLRPVRWLPAASAPAGAVSVPVSASRSPFPMPPWRPWRSAAVRRAAPSAIWRPICSNPPWSGVALQPFRRLRGQQNPEAQARFQASLLRWQGCAAQQRGPQRQLHHQPMHPQGRRSSVLERLAWRRCYGLVEYFYGSFCVQIRTRFLGMFRFACFAVAGRHCRGWMAADPPAMGLIHRSSA